MAITQKRSRIKQTGKRTQLHRKKKQHELGRLPVHTKVGEKKIKSVRTIGRNTKHKLIKADTINLFDPKSKKHYKVKAKSVLENPANRHFVRRNILTKGTVIDTEAGKARITSISARSLSVVAEVRSNCLGSNNASE